jgi:hypothetical protein
VKMSFPSLSQQHLGFKISGSRRGLSQTGHTAAGSLASLQPCPAKIPLLGAGLKSFPCGPCS